MSLLMSAENEKHIIRKIIGKENIIKFIENLGITIESEISIISKSGDNLILDVKGSRIAIGKEIAIKIII